LGTDHFAVGYQNIRNDQISVQAATDNTVVTFRPVGTAEFQVTLNAGQTYSFASLMRIAGVPFERDVAALGLVASGQVGKSVQIDFGYRGQLGKALKDHGVRGGVTVQF
jgi:uncharacterized protein with beta-barrel porin domain